jgi:diguanylate cyclase
MPRIVFLIAPRGLWDFVFKSLIMVVLANMLAMAVVFTVHGYLPSGLVGQLTETTIIALPFVLLHLKVIAYLFELQTRLENLANTDVLTGLPNRRAFLEALEVHLAIGGDGHVFLLDADHFKAVNDRYGHDGGDKCLQAIAAHLHRVAGPGDTVARFGGEEFAVLLRGAGDAEARRVGALLVGPVPFAPPLPEKAEDAEVTLSAGGVDLSFVFGVQQVLSIADRLMYQAKANGRARFELSAAYPAMLRRGSAA